MDVPDNETALTAISVTLQDLEEGSVTLVTLEEAFGPDSLGLIIVNGLPSEFVALRKRVLSLSSCVANLPESELGTFPISLYLARSKAIRTG